VYQELTGAADNCSGRNNANALFDYANAGASQCTLHLYRILLSISARCLSIYSGINLLIKFTLCRSWELIRFVCYPRTLGKLNLIKWIITGKCKKVSKWLEYRFAEVVLAEKFFAKDKNSGKNWRSPVQVFELLFLAFVIIKASN